MIQDIISFVVSQLQVPNASPPRTPTFISGEKSFQNLIADEIMDEIVFLDEPITSNDTLTQGGYLEEEYPLVMLFAEKSELDWTPAQHGDAIDRQRSLRSKFINILSTGNYIRRIKSIRTLEGKNIYDVNLSGVLLFITVVPFNQADAC